MTFLDEGPHQHPTLPENSWLPAFPCHLTLSEHSSPRSLVTSQHSYSNIPMPPHSHNPSPMPSHRPSASVRNLPPLDLKALHAPCPVPTELHPERQHVENISTSLSRFRPYLFVGGDAAAQDVTNLRNKNITHIVNLAGNTTPNYHSNTSSFKYLRLYLRDDERQSLDHIFAQVGVFVDEARQNRSACFIHCVQGVSRSVTAALAYVMTHESISFEHAMRQMQSIRCIAAPNRGFMKILTELDCTIKYGRKRPRLYVLRNEWSHAGESNYVPMSVVKYKAAHAKLRCHHAYILEKGFREGYVAWRGSSVNDVTWHHAMRLAREMAELQSNHISAFSACGSHAKLLQIIEQGESEDVEEEMIEAMIMAAEDDDTM